MSQKTVKAEPTNSTYLDTYAWILFLQERYDEARAYIDRALACDDDSTENTSNGPSAVPAVVSQRTVSSARKSSRTVFVSAAYTRFWSSVASPAGRRSSTR